MNPILIYCSTPTKEQAQEIANYLIEKRRVACVSIVPKTVSTYVFEEVVEESKESLMLIKSFDTHFETVCDDIKSLHSYRIPEIIAQPLLFVEPTYLQWMKESVTKIN